MTPSFYHLVAISDNEGESSCSARTSSSFDLNQSKEQQKQARNQKMLLNLSKSLDLVSWIFIEFCFSPLIFNGYKKDKKIKLIKRVKLHTAKFT